MAKRYVSRGTTHNINIVYKKNGVATTLVGATIRFTMKKTEYDNDATDTTALIKKDVVTGNAQGEATITIDPVDTKSLNPAEYYYDIKIQESNGNIFKAYEGIIVLDGSPTNRVV